MTKVGGIGAKLLSKMGWKEGTGLGANSDGQVKPIQRSRRFQENQGLGLKKPAVDDQWWQKLMTDAYGSPTDAQSTDLFTACEGRRCRPHGKAKLARLEAHDRAIAPANPAGDNDSERPSLSSLKPTDNCETDALVEAHATAEKSSNNIKRVGKLSESKKRKTDKLRVAPSISKKKQKKSKTLKALKQRKCGS